jgi:hypothetical protein
MPYTANAYTIILTNGTQLGGSTGKIVNVNPDLDLANAVLSDLADTTLTSLALVRKGARNYTDIEFADLVHLTENFANSSPPVNPLQGQLWYDASNTVVKVFIANSWTVVGGGGLSTPVTISISGAGTGSASFNGLSNISIPLTLNTQAGLAAGTYDNPTVTVNSNGIVTAIAAGVPFSGSSYVTKTGDTMTGTLNISGVGNNLNVVNGKVQEGGNPLIPQGAIMMWSGSVAPGGWNLCDGTNGTPNLSGSFIVGLGGAQSYTLGATGGFDFQSINTAAGGGIIGGVGLGNMISAGAHNHSGATAGYTLGIGDIPSHNHLSGVGQNNGAASIYGVVATDCPGFSTGHEAQNAGASGFQTTTNSVGGGGSHSHAISTDGVHVHTGNTSAIPTHVHAVSFDNRPVYYALAYIMKL